MITLKNCLYLARGMLGFSLERDATRMLRIVKKSKASAGATRTPPRTRLKARHHSEQSFPTVFG